MYSNFGPSVFGANVLSTAPQPLPQSWKKIFLIDVSSSSSSSVEDLFSQENFADVDNNKTV